MRSSHWLLPLVSLLFLAAGTADAQVRVTAPDGAGYLTIGGQIQPRYEYSARKDAEDLSSFLLRRARLDIRGSIVSPAITFRVLPEFARTTSLRDAWVNYAFSPTLQVRAGQFQLPFQFEREIGATRLHLVERTITGEAFGFPDARDHGVMLHGMPADRRWYYRVGIFDGAGRNVGLSNSAGNVISSRASFALLGIVPADQTDFTASPSPNLAIALGLQAATRNEARRWDLGRAAGASPRADWATGVADVSFRGYGLSLMAEGFLRTVDPIDPDIARYDGGGFAISTGYAVLPGRIEAVGRYSGLRLDLEEPATGVSEWGVGMTIFHRGHDVKTRINYLNLSGAGVPVETGSLIVEFSVAF